ncbi:NAD(P)/FAD-dependent oxidoreductase [Microbacterium sp. NPDC080220]|uniref:NAD(P)/FAD-dependent oxidoreductase n=1 Tax=Microbacterium sp. NPDC080220 TaxID=3161017 RepID=UPI00341729CB
MTSVGLSHRRAIIVGAGQTGLAVAAELISRGLRPQQDFVMIDAAPPGHRSWRTRWHSMELLSSARHSGLTVRPVPGDPHRHPRADEIADYLHTVEGELGVTPVWEVRALKLERRGEGTALTLTTTAGEVQTRNVVCATGAAARPLVPEWATRLQLPGALLHSSDYHYPRQIPPGQVLVVGGGHSGVQIARELAGSHTVTLSTRSPRRLRSISRQRTTAGVPTAWVPWPKGPEPDSAETLSGRDGSRVRVAAAVADVADRTSVQLTTGKRLRGIESLILATGYEPADQWLPEATRSDTTRRTRTSMPGLFVAGVPAYSWRRADTLAGVWRDAATIARQIVDRP